MKPFPFVDRLSLEKFDKTKPRFDHMHKPKLFFPFYTLTTRGNLILIKLPSQICAQIIPELAR